MAELHETRSGRKLLEYDIPEIHIQLTRIADALENKEVKNLISHFPNDTDLGKQIRKLCNTK